MKDSVLRAENVKPSFLHLLLLQGVVVIYTLAGIAAKAASGYAVLSAGFIGFYALEIAILGVYALLWQQVIKRISLNAAYANRSVALLWSLVWAALFFHESVSLRNIIGVAIVIAGTVLVTSNEVQ